MDLSNAPFLSAREIYIPVRTKSMDSQDEESQSDDTSLSVDHERRPKLKHRRWLQTARRFALLALAGWGFLALCLQAAATVGWLLPPSSSSSSAIAPSRYYDVYRPATLPPDLSLCDCGTTLSSALERGCIFDAMAAAWLPPHCRDAELTDRFERAGPGADGRWAYFADANGTRPLSTAEVGALGPAGGTFWATREWHVAHCLFYWEKYWRMRHTGAVMERKFDQVEHVQHCRTLALNPQPDHMVLLEVTVSMNGELETEQPAHKHEHTHEHEHEHEVKRK